MSKTPIVRFAPSPTGPLHLGGARTALFNWLFARQAGGKFILRIDDTDRERSRPEFEKDILESLDWLKLDYDESHRQSERTKIYAEALERLLREGRAFWSEEDAADGRRACVIRFKNPGTTVEFLDLLRGPIRFQTEELGNFVLAKSLEEPLYHFASVVDDVSLNITHIIRGEDHISNTPRQLLIWVALGGKIPHGFVHLPLILAPNRSKLSKRAGARAVFEYRKEGYLPEALVNYLALLGWHPEDDKELLTRQELTRKFRLEKIQRGGAIFDEHKLNWFNREHFSRLTAGEQAKLIRAQLPAAIEKLPQFSETRLKAALPEIAARINKLGEVRALAEQGELDFYFRPPVPTLDLLKTTTHLPALIEKIKLIPPDRFEAHTIKEAVWEFATEKGRGEVLWPMRTALTGLLRSPDPFSVAAILGKEETIVRLTRATKTRERGFFKILALMVVAVVILGYFRVDIRGLLEPILKSPAVQANLSYLWELIQTIIRDYLLPPISSLWSLWQSKIP